MHANGRITIGLDAADGRQGVVCISAHGRALHDRILTIALERGRALLSGLKLQEREALLNLLRRLHDNLPVVEQAAASYLARHDPLVAQRRRKRDTEK